MAILHESALYAPTFDSDYHHPNFSTRHLLKDLRLFYQEAAARGLTTDALERLPLLLERAINQGLGDLDYSALFELVNPPTRGFTLS